VFGVESGRVWVEGERQLEKDKYIRKTKVRSGTFIANGRHVIRLLTTVVVGHKMQKH
jgi:hypothetical protein